MDPQRDMTTSEPTEESPTEDTIISEHSKPSNVPQHLWEKFKQLEKRTNETTKRSTEKRIKHLQKTALDNVARSLHHPEDKEIVQLASGDRSGIKVPTSSAAPSVSSRKRGAPPGDTSEESEWRRVRGLMGANDHLAGVSHGNLGPKTVLELRVEEAITNRDFKTAEELSDRIAAREFGEKVAHAIDARNFLEHKQKEELSAKAKRKRKLHWGFEAKHRWESKSNM